MGQDIVGQKFVGQDVAGAISLGQEVSGAGHRGAGSRESKLRLGVHLMMKNLNKEIMMLHAITC